MSTSDNLLEPLRSTAPMLQLCGLAEFGGSMSEDPRGYDKDSAELIIEPIALPLWELPRISATLTLPKIEP